MDLPLKVPGMEVEVSTSDIKQKKHTARRRHDTTYFKAEAMALNITATEILVNLKKVHKQVVLFSDALLGTDALQTP